MIVLEANDLIPCSFYTFSVNHLSFRCVFFFPPSPWGFVWFAITDRRSPCAWRRTAAAVIRFPSRLLRAETLCFGLESCHMPSGGRLCAWILALIGKRWPFYHRRKHTHTVAVKRTLGVGAALTGAGTGTDSQCYYPTKKLIKRTDTAVCVIYDSCLCRKKRANPPCYHPLTALIFCGFPSFASNPTFSLCHSVLYIASSHYFPWLYDLGYC